MKALVGGLLIAAPAIASAKRCSPKPGQEPWSNLCDHITCDYTYRAYCQLNPGEPAHPWECIPKAGFEDFAEFCTYAGCATTYESFCAPNDGAAPAPSSSTTTTAAPAPSSSTTTTAAPAPSSSTSTTAPIVQPPPSGGIDCDSLAAAHPFPESSLPQACGVELVKSICTDNHTGCTTQTCMVDHLNAFYASLGLDGVAPPAPPPVSGEFCEELAAKATIPGMETSCKNEVVAAHCEASLSECDDAQQCAHTIVKEFVLAVGGTLDDSSNPPTSPPTTPSSSTSTTSTTYNGDPDDVPFARAVTPKDLVSIVPWGLDGYKGKMAYDAAKIIHAQIVEAIKDGPPEFKKFCGTGDLEKDRRECAAFFANVCKETGGMGTFEEATSDTYCTHRGDGDEGLQAAGKPYPCCLQEDKKTPCSDIDNCPFGCRMHGRGAIQLTWNFNYARFSEFYFGDQEVLLRNPEKVEPTGSSGWAASIWFWMTPQDFGGACPPPSDFSFNLPMGHQSCHQAMHDAEGGGFGQTIRIINGGYEACPKSHTDGAFHRIRYFLFTTGAWGVPAAPGCALKDLKCDVSGVEFYKKTDGKIGNPQIGFKRDATHCPSCGIPACEGEEKGKWLCGGNGGTECVDPIQLQDVTVCKICTDCPSVHPAPWE